MWVKKKVNRSYDLNIKRHESFLCLQQTFFFQFCVSDVDFSTLLCNLQGAAEMPLTGTPPSRSLAYAGMEVRNFSRVLFKHHNVPVGAGGSLLGLLIQATASR